jgi:hypothetical protein
MFARMAANGKVEHFAAFTFELEATLLQFASTTHPTGFAGGTWLCHRAGIDDRFGVDRCCAWGCFGDRYV